LGQASAGVYDRSYARVSEPVGDTVNFDAAWVRAHAFAEADSGD